jgi:O-antigen ligase
LAVLEGRAARPSLFIFAAGLLLLAASLLAGDAYRWGAIALLVAASAPWRLPSTQGVSVLLILLCGWMLANALFVTPAYAAEGLYRPVILFTSFMAIASLPREAAIRLFGGGVAVMAVLVLLGLAQHFLGFWHFDHNALRAAALFITPNTFATAINFFLLPLTVLYLASDRSPRILALALWLFAGLVASQSRGGMLAFMAGLTFALVCIGWRRLRESWKYAAGLAAGAAAVWLLVAGISQVAPGVGIGAGQSPAPAVPGSAVSSQLLDPWVGRMVWDREEIYAATWRLIRERPLSGAGANMFRPLFEPVRPAVFGDKGFLFAHNDYLQIWLEYGLAGLLLFVGLGAAALARARRMSRRSRADPLPLACGAALAACFAHAVVDFPFYIPFILFLVGSFCGVLAPIARNGDAASGEAARARAWPPVAVRATLALAALALLAQPMVAQLAARHALSVMARGDVSGGLYWESVARRLEPRNPEHYWTEAVIWQQLAQDSGDRAQWARADALLAEGIRANPPNAFTITLDRARMHRLHADKLDQPGSPEEILGWVEGAVALAPTSVVGQAELARALAYAGRTEEARRIERMLLARAPDHPLVRTLAKDLK